jgi:hypothetical protein
MERDGERARHFNELRSAFDIDGSVGLENADHDIVGAKFFRHDQITLHYGELVLGVTKVSASRAEHHRHSDSDSVSHDLEKAGTGSQASLEQGSAKLDSIGSALLRSEGGFNGIDTDLKQNAVWHKFQE